MKFLSKEGSEDLISKINEYADYFVDYSEIKVSNHLLGTGGKGNVYKGVFSGEEVAIKKMQIIPRVGFGNLGTFFIRIRIWNKN